MQSKSEYIERFNQSQPMTYIHTAFLLLSEKAYENWQRNSNRQNEPKTPKSFVSCYLLNGTTVATAIFSEFCPRNQASPVEKMNSMD